ncbi:MAG: hypothetical protein Q9168_003591 [Polycauliona sp. 1 TL-2023]
MPPGSSLIAATRPPRLARHQFQEEQHQPPRSSNSDATESNFYYLTSHVLTKLLQGWSAIDMKSLDHLIRFLLEDIALCGDHGAGTSHFIEAVKAYYSFDAVANDGHVSTGGPNTFVDQKLLEKIWHWLARHPEVQIGKDAKFNRLSLSEVEHLNHSRSSGENVDHALSTPQPSLPAESPDNLGAEQPVNVIVENQGDPCGPNTELRVYVSTERRWWALTGHAYDPERVPRLDFACLSIIAAHRDQGILQPELIRISGQDKRSVPQRTQRLYDAGYISKIPLLVNRAHTSRLILQKYTIQATGRDNDAEGANDPNTIFQPARNSMENPTDLLAMHHAIFDLLRERKLITTVELKDKIGVTGLAWPMRVLARHLRRLEGFGCLKQVRAYPDIEAPSPFLFRCIRYIRDPVGQEWNAVIYRSKASRAQSTATVANELDAPSDDEQDYQAEEAHYIARFGKNQRPESLREAERHIPQWSGDSTVSNLLYDITHAAGCRGISTMELKNRSMGCFIGRPVEYHISRLVEMWQISQPLHLRHLSIIRDSAMTNSIPHYIHYSYESFKRLADQGKASWDLVMTITKEHAQLKDIAAIEAQPDLDGDGFPKIPVASFQGRHQDASLSDCSRDKDISVPCLTIWDPRAVRLQDNNWTIRNNVVSQARSQPRRKRTPRRPPEPGDEPNLVVTYNRGRGRVRKIQAEGFPPGFNRWTGAEKSKFLKSQFAARLYKMKKLVEEIERRVKSGTDRYEATASVLVLAVKQYRNLGLEPPWDMMNKVKSDTLAPSLLALKGFDQKCSLSTIFTKGRNISEVVNLWSSSATHSRPLREAEWQLVERILRSRIQTVQDVPIEQSIPPAESSILLDTENHEAQSNKEIPSTSSKAKRDKVPSRPKVKPAQQKKLVKNLPPSSAQLEEIAKQYLPSTVAHSRPILLTELKLVDRQSLKRKPDLDEGALGRRPKRIRTKKLPFAYETSLVASPTTSQSQKLPLRSYAQQVQSVARPTPGLYMSQVARLSVPGKPGPGRMCLLAIFNSPRIQDLEFAPMQSPKTPQPLATQECLNSKIDNVHLQPQTPSRQKLPVQSYEQQLQNISRPTIGFYLGSEAKLAQTRKRGRACKSRLAVFKSPLIQSLTCLTEEQLPISHPSIIDQGPTNVRPSDSVPRHGKNKSISATVSPAPQVLAAPDVMPGLEESSSVVQHDSALEGESNKENDHQRDLDGGAAKHIVPSKQLRTAPQKAQSSLGGRHGSNGPSNSAAHGQESPRMENIHGIPSLTHDGTSIPIGESLGNQGPPTPKPQISEISNAACPQTELSNTMDIDGGLIAEDTVLNPQNSTLALSEQNQSTNMRSPSSMDVPRPRISASQVPETEREERQAQPLQNAEHSDANSRQSREPSATIVGGPCHQNLIGGSTKQKVRSGVKKVTLQGGTIAAQRRKIIMDIVEKCGGIYPGAAELCAPFREEWRKAGYPGRPETSTLKIAVKALCDNGKLRQLTFVFKDPRGAMIKKDMVTKVEISPTDPGVIATQKNIIDMYPCQYIPEETGLADEARNVMWTPEGRAKMRTVKDLEVDEGRVQLEKVPNRVENYEIKYKSRQNRKAEEKRRFAELRELMAAGRLPQKDARSVQRKVDRLESLNQKLHRDPHGRSSLPSTDEQAETDLHPSHLSMARGAAHGKHSQTQLNEFFRKQTRKRLAELQQGKQIPQSQPVGSRRRGRPPKARGGKESISGPSKVASSHRRSGPNNLTEVSAFRRSRKALMLHRDRLDSDWHSPEARQQLYTIMEPEHFFHAATGTFAVNFSRSRTVNQICHRYHWQLSSARGFADHVDDLMIYELTANGSQQAKYKNWPFVNYTYPHAQRTTCDQEPSTHDLWFSKARASRRGYNRMGSERSSSDEPTDPSASQSIPGSEELTKRKRDTSEGLGSFKTRRLTTVAKLSQLMKSRTAVDASGRPGHADKSRKKSVMRRERGLTAEEMQRILFAVIVVRTLTGGVERNIDWVLVTKICDPEHDQASVQRKWPRVLQSHRLLAQQLEANFQDLFLQAYKDGLIPPLDYDDLLAYDWAWLVDWTIKHIDLPTSGAPDLPSQRERLDRIFQLSISDDADLHTYYEVDAPASVPRRELDLHKKACVQPLTNTTKEPSDAQSENMAIVKTWIRANVATKARTYNPLTARDKLAQFSTNLIDRALEEMLHDRILMAHNKGRPMPGRNYDLSEHYLKPLKKKIEAAKFLRAPFIKRRIDKTLAVEKGEYIVTELTDDVEMVVLQNMQASGRISLLPVNPPMKKFGLTDNGSYKIRSMDKRKLHFAVGVRLTGSYVEGNPLSPLPEPPSIPLPHRAEGEEEARIQTKMKIPLWYDINNDLIIELWQLALAATMSMLVLRSGITARMLETSVRSSLALWEVQMILDWMVRARVAELKEGVYSAAEWWWLCLDNGDAMDMDVDYEASRGGGEGNDMEGGERIGEKV